VWGALATEKGEATGKRRIEKNTCTERQRERRWKKMQKNGLIIRISGTRESMREIVER